MLFPATREMERNGRSQANARYWSKGSMASRDDRPADKKSVPSDIRKLHCLGKHFLPTRVGPVSVPPSGASAATFDQVPEGTCPCPWRLPLLSKPTVLLCGFPVTPGHPNSEATCRPGAAPPRSASEHPPSLPSPEGFGSFCAPLRRLPPIRSKPAEELARLPLAASLSPRPKPRFQIGRSRPAPPQGQLASTPWDKS